MKIFGFIFLLVILNSCTKEITSIKPLSIKEDKKIEKTNKENYSFYLIGEPYSIDGTMYVPKEDYNYSEIGLSSYFGKKYNKKRTANNEIIDITENIAAHKTLPLPSLVKVTNLENDSSIIVRINDRGPNSNEYIIILSIQAAKLLDFYENKTAKVKVEIMPNESKQLKIVAESINSNLNLETITAAPTDEVKILTSE